MVTGMVGIQQNMKKGTGVDLRKFCSPNGHFSLSYSQGIHRISTRLFPIRISQKSAASIMPASTPHQPSKEQREQLLMGGFAPAAIHRNFKRMSGG